MSDNNETIKAFEEAGENLRQTMEKNHKRKLRNINNAKQLAKGLLIGLGVGTAAVFGVALTIAALKQEADLTNE